MATLSDYMQGYNNGYSDGLKAAKERAATSDAPSADAVDAQRYRWLRDVSVPPHNFFLSVPEEFKDVKYSKAEVDAEIDKAITASAPKGDGND